MDSLQLNVLTLAKVMGFVHKSYLKYKYKFLVDLAKREFLELLNQKSSKNSRLRSLLKIGSEKDIYYRQLLLFYGLINKLKIR